MLALLVIVLAYRLVTDPAGSVAYLGGWVAGAGDALAGALATFGVFALMIGGLWAIYAGAMYLTRSLRGGGDQHQVALAMVLTAAIALAAVVSARSGMLPDRGPPTPSATPTIQRR